MDLRFVHGVASGDPLSDRIVLWTRVSVFDDDGEMMTASDERCVGEAESVDVRYRIAESRDVAVSGTDEGTIATGVVEARCENDWTVKVDIVGLRSEKEYFYAFDMSSDASSATIRSPIGRFKLPPSSGERLDALTFAVFSCTNWGYGYFSSYAHASRLESLDFWMHLGDYIYEYDPSTSYAVRTSELLRTRISNLTEYRQRYETYHTDTDLQALRARAPLIAAWDDHEFANDAWVDGAGAHDEDLDGPWSTRRTAAARAYEEWIPIRTTGTTRRRVLASSTEREVSLHIERTFDFGNLVRLSMVESRVTNRSNPYTENFSWGSDLDNVKALLDATPGANESVSYWTPELHASIAAYAAQTRAHAALSERTILGQAELDWLEERLRTSDARWQIVGQQQVLQPQMLPNYTKLIEDDAFDASWLDVIANATETPLSENPTLEVRSPLAHWDERRGQHLSVSSYYRKQYLAYRAAGYHGVVLNFDGWNGYSTERDRFVSRMQRSGKENVVVLGGDSHNAWAGLLRSAENGEIVAAEFDGQGTTSPGMEKSFPLYPPDMLAAGYVATNEDMVFSDTSSKGYMLFEVTESTFHGEFVSVSVNVNGTALLYTPAASSCVGAYEYRGGGQAMTSATCYLTNGESGKSHDSGAVILALAIVVIVALGLSIAPIVWALQRNGWVWFDSMSRVHSFTELDETTRRASSRDENASDSSVEMTEKMAQKKGSSDETSGLVEVVI